VLFTHRTINHAVNDSHANTIAIMIRDDSIGHHPYPAAAPLGIAVSRDAHPIPVANCGIKKREFNSDIYFHFGMKSDRQSVPAYDEMP
jgi:hypothetical protein